MTNTTGNNITKNFIETCRKFKENSEGLGKIHLSFKKFNKNLKT